MNTSKQQFSEDESSSPSPKKQDKKANATKAKSKIIINVSDCQYPVVGKVAKDLGWKKQNNPDANDWDICWTDNAVQPQTLAKMELHQKINHFPAMYNLARKNLLGKGLMKMRKQFPNEYNFFPLTWMLPVEYHELKAYYDGKAKGKARTFIVKPESLSQGKGIFLTRKLEDINPTAHCVVQRYLHKPYLIDGLKFDLRIYVLISSVDPLTIYLYDEGLGRFATEAYEAPTRQNMQDVCMHLTNYAINKDNPKFVFNQSQKDMSKGHKRSLTSVYELLEQRGVNVPQLKSKIKDSIIKTMISGLPHLSNTYRSCQPQNYSANMCFQLLGFDVMLTDKCEPILLEINHTPSFTTDTPLDQYIKFNYIRDSLVLMNINDKTKQEIIKQQKEACQQRIMTGKKTKFTLQQRQQKKIAALSKKQKYESHHQGRFQKIYPLLKQGKDQYLPYIQYVEDLYNQMTGSKRTKKNQKAEELLKQAPPKPKPKRPTLTTTPDLINRNLIAQRRYESKRSIDFKQQKQSTSKSLTNQADYKEITNFIKSPSNVEPQNNLMKQLKDLSVHKSPHNIKFLFEQRFTKEEQKIKEATLNQFAQKVPQKHQQNFMRQNISQKRMTKQKQKQARVQPKSMNQKQKIPITLNTLLINGIEQNAVFPINNLKKFIVNQRNKYE